MKVKRCFKCGETKPLDAYYTHPRMADGHLNKCKECTKRDTKATVKANPEKRAAYERERWDRPARKKAVRASLRAARKRDPERFAQYSKDSDAKYPERKKARSAVGHAVRDGRLKKLPCSACKTKKNVQAHHDDYSKPLKVCWLCRRCHGLEHRKAS